MYYYLKYLILKYWLSSFFYITKPIINFKIKQLNDKTALKKSKKLLYALKRVIHILKYIIGPNLLNNLSILINYNRKNNVKHNKSKFMF